MASLNTVTAPSKRKADSTGALRPRKKQAVTKTFNRSTIKKIEQNALNSPLLSLPGEIREKILKLVVGDKVIHINVCDFGVKGRQHHRGSLCHILCSEPGKTCGCFLRIQKTTGGHCFCRPTSEHSFGLHRLSSGPMFQPSNRVKVSILATSRQLYEECNLLIWHTNTFSFEVPTAFTIFLESLNTQQMRNIRNLQIRPLASQLTFPGQHGIYRNGNGDRIVGIQQWNLGDSRGQLIQRLHAVKSLRIQLKYVACGDVIEPSRFQLELALSNLQVLRSIPLEYATVDFDIRRLPGYADKTVDPKIKQLAAEFQRMLLDPAGPEKVKEFGVPKRPTRLHSQFPGNIFSSENIYFYMGSEWPE